jgi:hypothetical protein
MIIDNYCALPAFCECQNPRLRISGGQGGDPNSVRLIEERKLEAKKGFPADLCGKIARPLYFRAVSEAYC